MSDSRQPAPGVSRSHRLSDEGLERLEKQLARGARMKPEILQQWVRKYGQAAQDIIDRYQDTST